MQAKPTSKIVWSRIPSASGDYCDGYQAKGIPGLRIMRHYVDDRESNGYVGTFWNLYVDDEPVDQYSTLETAKLVAERAVNREQTAKMEAAEAAARDRFDTERWADR